MLRYAVLLDGGFVRRKLATATRPLAAEDVGSLVASIGNFPELAQMRTTATS